MSIDCCNIWFYLVKCVESSNRDKNVNSHLGHFQLPVSHYQVWFKSMPKNIMFINYRHFVRRDKSLTHGRPIGAIGGRGNGG